ncbi:VTT domain-containing protein [Candidatus Giovannonibacteria bacterium]|nr:VTT domain-containing protein [Candidatus Giovannonibacteria bacterium]
MQNIIDLILAYKYTAIFIGLLTGGETVLLPALYIAVTNGALDIKLVVAINILATVISDSFWYILGRWINKETILSSRFFSKKLSGARDFSEFFERHSLYAVFISKFIYGTRMITQVLAGMHKTSFIKYMAVDIMGILSLTGVFLILIEFLQVSIGMMLKLTYGTEIIFGIFVIIVLILLSLFKRIIKKKWLQQ